MGIVTGIVVYVLLWWWVLFMLLPIKAAPPEKSQLGHSMSAPKKPYIFVKFVLAAVISMFLWIIIYYIISNKIMSEVIF